MVVCVWEMRQENYQKLVVTPRDLRSLHVIGGANYKWAQAREITEMCWWKQRHPPSPNTPPPPLTATAAGVGEGPGTALQVLFIAR